MNYTIESIASIIGAKRYGHFPATISWPLTDSRSLIFPETSLFFALTTQHGDGHHYIPSLYQRGVRNFVVSQLPANLQSYAETNFLLTPSPLSALQLLARHHRETFSLPIIGITGSTGKTIVKEWLYQLLSPSLSITRSPRSYNSQTGLPLSVCLLDEVSQMGIFEAGISQPDEMSRLQPILQPTIGILTNIGEAHGENFTSPFHKSQEKMQLFKDCPILITSLETANAYPSIRATSSALFLWSIHNPEAEVFISQIEKSDDHTCLTYTYQGEAHQLSIPFIDDASIENAVTCLTCCLHLHLEPVVIGERMARLEPVAMRLEVKDGVQGCVLISDSYNSDLSSLKIALDFMDRRRQASKLNRTLILSDMVQTGISPEKLYGDISALVSRYPIDTLIGIGPQMAAFIHLFPGDRHSFLTTHEFLQSPLTGRLSQSLILIKGASAYHFSTITALLSSRAHQTTLEVNLSSLVSNLNHYRSFLKPDTAIVCMVKASAYGAGDIEVARTLEEHRVDYLAVATSDEGVTLRRAGISTGIIIMNPELTSFHDLFQYHLEPEVYNFTLLQALIRATKTEGLQHFPIHLKIDTGMHRLGFSPDTDDIPQLIQILKNQSELLPRSIFSHFVGSDDDAFDTFSHHQHDLFLKASDTICQAFPHHILRHICNTAGIERFPQYHHDMVRLGLGLYGINPYHNKMLSPVSALYTTIISTRSVPADDTVGYSRRGRLHRPTRLATLPIGYADGLNRHLGCGAGYCLIHGKKTPYVGNICMDVCMVDITDIPQAREGDRVTIFGPGLPITILSNILQTIPYEVLTSVSPRVTRIYYQD